MEYIDNRKLYKYKKTESLKGIVIYLAILLFLTFLTIVFLTINHSIGSILGAIKQEGVYYFLAILICFVIMFLYYELPRYLFVKDLIIEYDKENRNVTYFYGDNYINFSFSDIALFEVYRTVKDEGYIGYVVTLKNGTRLRFTNRLDGIEELQKDIEASGVKTKDRTWFDNKHLPENIYI